jgi:hypothetical protein
MDSNTAGASYVARLEGGPLDGLSFAVADAARLIELPAPPARPAGSGTATTSARLIARDDLAGRAHATTTPRLRIQRDVYSRPAATTS